MGNWLNGFMLLTTKMFFSKESKEDTEDFWLYIYYVLVFCQIGKQNTDEYFVEIQFALLIRIRGRKTILLNFLYCLGLLSLMRYLSAFSPGSVGAISFQGYSDLFMFRSKVLIPHSHTYASTNVSIFTCPLLSRMVGKLSALLSTPRWSTMEHSTEKSLRSTLPSLYSLSLCVCFLTSV